MRKPGGRHPDQCPSLAACIGGFTVKMTWAEIVALYRLTLDRPPHNLQPRCNVCPTDPIDVVTERDGKRDFVRKPLKELRGATFNARAETVETNYVHLTEPAALVIG
jgi:putative SOS response-associated peptidase YedK